MSRVSGTGSHSISIDCLLSTKETSTLWALISHVPHVCASLGFSPPDVFVPDEPDSLLCGGEAEPNGAGELADWRDAPLAVQRAVLAARAGTAER